MNLGTPEAISKLFSTLGEPLMADQAIVQRTKLAYARLLIDLKDARQAPQLIKFHTL